MFESFGFSPKELISLSGGGGKTSLLFALSDFFLPRHSIMTTTTKIAVPTGEVPVFVGDMAFCKRTAFSLSDPAQAIYARSEKNGKLIGFSAEEVDDFYRKEKSGCLLVEADGAKGFPFKGYKGNEPVIPRLSTHLIVMVGAEIFFQKPNEKVIFRLSELKQRWDFDENNEMRIPLIAAILEDSEGYLRGAPNPSHCRRTLFINKGDLLDPSSVITIARALELYLTQYHDLYIGSLLNRRIYLHRKMRFF